jgi:hypothetical protein
MLGRQNRRHVLRLPLLDRVRTFFGPRPATAPVDPLHSHIPALRNAEIAAIYHGQRMAGEFLRVPAGCSVTRALRPVRYRRRREETRQVLIAAQTMLRTLAVQLFRAKHVNEADAMIELSQQINRTILQFEGGVRSCPAFIGCFNEDLGTICYANAGHTPALLRDTTGIYPTGSHRSAVGPVLSHYPGCLHCFAGSGRELAHCFPRHRGGGTRWRGIRPRRRGSNFTESIRRHGP